MMELTIGGKVYQFRFGLGFVREIDKRVTKPMNGINGKVQNMGMQFAVAGLIDQDPVELVEILDVANKTEKPRVTRQELDAYIEDENTDTDALFSEVLDFLKSANATKKITESVIEETEKAKKKVLEEAEMK